MIAEELADWGSGCTSTVPAAVAGRSAAAPARRDRHGAGWAARQLRASPAAAPIRPSSSPGDSAGRRRRRSSGAGAGVGAGRRAGQRRARARPGLRRHPRRRPRARHSGGAAGRARRRRAGRRGRAEPCSRPPSSATRRCAGSPRPRRTASTPAGCTPRRSPACSASADRRRPAARPGRRRGRPTRSASPGSQAGGLLEFLHTGASTKQLHPGFAGHAGILAARLAAAGAAGPATVLEGPHGVYAALAARRGRPRVHHRRARQTLGDNPDRHQAVPGVPALPRRVDAVRDAVRARRCPFRRRRRDRRRRAPRLGAHGLRQPAGTWRDRRRRTPRSSRCRGPSPPLLVDGDLTTATYEPDSLARPEVERVARRVRWHVAPTRRPRSRRARQRPGHARRRPRRSRQRATQRRRPGVPADRRAAASRSSTATPVATPHACVDLLSRLGELDTVRTAHGGAWPPPVQAGTPVTTTRHQPPAFPWFPYEGFTFCLGLAEGDAAWTSGHTSAAFDEAVGKDDCHRATWPSRRATAYAKVLRSWQAAGLRPADVTRVIENVTVAGLDALPAAAGGAAGDLRRPRRPCCDRHHRPAGAPQALHRGRGARHPRWRRGCSSRSEPGRRGTWRRDGADRPRRRGLPAHHGPDRRERRRRRPGGLRRAVRATAWSGPASCCTAAGLSLDAGRHDHDYSTPGDPRRVPRTTACGRSCSAAPACTPAPAAS